MGNYYHGSNMAEFKKVRKKLYFLTSVTLQREKEYFTKGFRRIEAKV